MARLILDEKTMKFSSVFYSITHAKLRNCFIDNEIVIFIVEPGEIAKAIGKKAANIRKLENILKSRIKVVEYSPNPEDFIGKLVYPAKIKDITKENNIFTIIPLDLNSRGLMIGRNAQNLRHYEKIVKHYFKIDELKVK